MSKKSKLLALPSVLKLAGVSLMMGIASWSYAQTSAVALDRVVAIVDEDVVLESEFNERKESILARLQGQFQNLPPENVLNKQILEQLIVERIELGLAKRYEIEPTEAELDQAIARIAQNNQITLAQLQESLSQQGMNMTGLRQQVRRDLTINQLQQAVVNSRIKITDQDIDNFLASTDGKFATSPDFRVGHILVALPSSATPSEIIELEEKALDIYKRIQAGADFSQMAITHSQDQAALNGGDLGWRKLAQLPELFAQRLVDLAVGEISEPFRSDAGFHIVKNMEQRGGGATMIQETKARHILVKTSEIMDDRQAREKLLSVRERALKGEDFAVLARENSEDTGSMLGGGDLGWATPGMFVPEFEETMEKSAINEISMPFKSQFGWHIMQVTERRNTDMSDRVKRNQAANAIRSRRFDEEFQLWLTQIREDAYVEIKLPGLENKPEPKKVTEETSPKKGKKNKK